MENEETQETDINEIEEAKTLLANLTAQNKIMSENLNRQERMMATQMLSGKSTAGQPSQSEDEKITESARKLLAGTGFETLL